MSDYRIQYRVEYGVRSTKYEFPRSAVFMNNTVSCLSFIYHKGLRLSWKLETKRLWREISPSLYKEISTYSNGKIDNIRHIFSEDNSRWAYRQEKRKGGAKPLEGVFRICPSPASDQWLERKPAASYSLHVGMHIPPP